MGKIYQYRVNKLSLVKEKSEFFGEKIKSSVDSADFLRKFYSSDIDIYESMFLMLMDQAANVHGYVKISQGGTAGTVCDIKLIANYAISSLSESVILCHNHPSGNLQPSASDEKITARVKDALKLFDINLLDHIILSSEGYYSFADERKM